MTNLQAALGLTQLRILNHIIKLKKKIFLNYKKKLAHLKNISIINDDKYTNWMFAIVVKSFKNFKIVQNCFNKSGIQMDLFWKPLHIQSPYKNFKTTNLKYTNSIWNKVIVLPSHPAVKLTQQSKIINILLKNIK